MCEGRIKSLRIDFKSLFSSSDLFCHKSYMVQGQLVNHPQAHGNLICGLPEMPLSVTFLKGLVMCDQLHVNDTQEHGSQLEYQRADLPKRANCLKMRSEHNMK